MKTKLAALTFTFLIGFSISCNKQKKLMENMIGNWEIKSSERAYLNTDGSETVYETLSYAGTLVIFEEDPDNPSETTKLYDFTFIDGNGDTLTAENRLVTDDKNKRIILKNALSDADTLCDIVWTIEKNKKNSQTWAVYGVDSTFFYPTNNQNPGAAVNSLVWRMELKRQ